MAPAAVESRDWSQLLPDLLQEIAGHLTEIPDRIRFRCVCPRWRSATELIPRPPRQLPWLLLPLELDLKTRSLPNIADFKVKSKRRFLSVAERRIYELPLIDCIQLPLPIDDDIDDDPAFPHIWMCGDIASCSMLLPASLPPLPKEAGAVKKVKIFSSSSSSCHDPIIVILGRFYFPGVFFCRPGETTWKKIHVPYYSPPRGFAFHDNRFFALHPETAVVSVFDLDTVQKTRQIPAPVKYGFNDTEYLVETPFGELLLIIHMEKNTDRVFRLFQLDKTKFEWTKISSIGDNVLFLERVQAIAFDARGLTSCRGNSIYFLDLNDEGIWLFDVEKGRVEETPILEIEDCSTDAFWMVPTMR